MSVLEGKLVRSSAGVEGRVHAVALAEYAADNYPEGGKRVGFIALVCKEDGKLTHILLEGATVVVDRPAPYVPPPPTAIPGGGR